MRFHEIFLWGLYCGSLIKKTNSTVNVFFFLHFMISLLEKDYSQSCSMKYASKILLPEQSEKYILARVSWFRNLFKTIVSFSFQASICLI